MEPKYFKTTPVQYFAVKPSTYYNLVFDESVLTDAGYVCIMHDVLQTTLPNRRVPMSFPSSQ